ncbi:MAG TPA: hypothetical protein PKX48_08195 [Planctomycetota bacterium]|nr:hypothetical protein [Planctomycetota bacterium]HNR99785.1 hypothetical protein [Planctomycetota bacterium]HNU26946.1 hypothetical protein [Planctomycetota bacterium]HOE29844.1 hypothetical protein [Planctomycetota bacterium]HOE86917.1 hypothetical protein [Planctomycetota bacterium]
MTSVWERFLGTFRERAARLAAGLTPSQKIAAAVLAGAVCLGLLFAAFFSGRGEFTALARHQDGGELRRMALKLENAGYGVRVEQGALRVKSEQLPQALNYLASEVTSGPRRDGWAWLDQDPQWGDTSVRLSEKVKRAKTINLEESIKACPDIVDAIVELNIKREPLTVLGGGGASNSASVAVTLAPGIGRLTNAQVRTIRAIVSGGAPIPFQAVKVADNRLNEYALEDDGSGGGAGFDERRLAHIAHYKREIAAYMGRTFRESEYSLFVDVKLDRRKTESDAELVAAPESPVKVKERAERETHGRASGADPAGGAPGDGGGERMVSEVEYAPVVGRTRDKTVKPAGAIQEVAVAVRVDKAAVGRVVAALNVEAGPAEPARPGIDAAGFCKELEDEIRNMLAIQGKVSVSVLPGVMLAAPAAPEAAPPIRTAAAGEWASRHAALIAGVLFVIAALGFIYTLARRAVPPPIDIPPAGLLDGHAAEGGEESRAADTIAELRLEDEDFAEDVGAIGVFCRTRPGAAAEAVRAWAEADARPAEGDR